LQALRLRDEIYKTRGKTVHAPGAIAAAAV